MPSALYLYVNQRSLQLITFQSISSAVDSRVLEIPEHHWTFYSATSFLEKFRKVVPEKWFFKLGFFFWSTTFLQPEKM